jgi:hypothetical protein
MMLTAPHQEQAWNKAQLHNLLLPWCHLDGLAGMCYLQDIVIHSMDNMVRVLPLLVLRPPLVHH